jgi:hypothetical protein
VPHRTLLVTVAGDSASVRECVIDDTQEIDRPTGKVVNGKDESLLLETTLERHEGAWLRSSSYVVTMIAGVAKCLES